VPNESLVNVLARQNPQVIPQLTPRSRLLEQFLANQTRDTISSVPELGLKLAATGIAQFKDNRREEKNRDLLAKAVAEKQLGRDADFERIARAAKSEFINPDTGQASPIVDPSGLKGGSSGALAQAMLGANTPEIRNQGLAAMLADQRAAQASKVAEEADIRASKRSLENTLTANREDRAFRAEQSGLTREAAMNAAKLKAAATLEAARLKAGSSGKPKAADLSVFRKEFTNLSKPFLLVKDAFKKVRAGAENPSAAGDLGMIFSIMKMFDPGSTVREGEFATAQNSAGVPDRVRAMYNNVQSGKRLTPPQRQDFLDTAGHQFNAHLTTQLELENEFRDISAQQGFNSRIVVPDFIKGFRTFSVKKGGDASKGSVNASQAKPKLNLKDKTDEEIQQMMLDAIKTIGP